MPKSATTKIRSIRICASESEQIRQWILARKFTNLQNRFPVGNSRNTVAQIHIEGLGDFLLKRTAFHQEHRLDRRINFFFRALLKNDSALAYKGSTWIREAGLPTIEPMATWLTGPAYNPGLESWFLYRPVEAEHSLLDLKEAASVNKTDDANDPQATRRYADAVQATGHYLRTMHQAKVRHHDVGAQNLLIQSDGSIAVIDNDRVSRQLFRLPFFSTVFDLRSLRRLNLGSAEPEFLEAYFGAPPAPWIYRMQRLVRFQPWRRLRGKKS